MELVILPDDPLRSKKRISPALLRKFEILQAPQSPAFGRLWPGVASWSVRTCLLALSEGASRR